MTAVVLSAAKDLLLFVISSVAPRSGAQSRDLMSFDASPAGAVAPPGPPRKTGSLPPTPRNPARAALRCFSWAARGSSLAVGLLALAALGGGARAQSRPSAERFARLAVIDSALERAVREGQVAGASLLVLRDGRPMYERQFGWADREAQVRMDAKSIFRIASQSKAVTSTAIMMLVEEGRLGLGDAVSRYIPAFARTTVAVKTDTGRTIVPVRRQITIRDLLTHTSGYSYGTDSLVAPLYAAQGLGPVAGYGWYTADKTEGICASMERVAALPAVAQPGTQWVYGYNTDILGCVVERVSGVPLDEFIRTRIAAPLGMRDTKFYLDPAERARLAAVYMSDSSRKAVRAPDGARGQGHYVDGPRTSFAGGAGLLSTARDYARFLEMIRRGGAVDGVRLLSPRSVELMSTNQVGVLFNPDGATGLGLAFEVTQRLGADGYRSVGSYAWGGAYGSTYWIDPSERMVVVWMVQMLPNRADIGGRVPQLVYQALVP